MNKAIEIILASILLLSLSGCNDEDVKSKDFYMQNEKARITKVKYCNDRPDKKIIDQNCINALDANAQLKTEQFRGEGIPIDYSAIKKKEKTPYEKMIEEKMALKKKTESTAQ